MRFFRRRKRDVIDLVLSDVRDGRWGVGLVHGQPWREDGGDLSGLQKRLSDCHYYIASGQMHEDVPESVGKPKVVRLFYAEEPNAITAEFLLHVRAALEAEGIDFETEPIPTE